MTPFVHLTYKFDSTFSEFTCEQKGCFWLGFFLQCSERCCDWPMNRLLQREASERKGNDRKRKQTGLGELISSSNKTNTN